MLLKHDLTRCDACPHDQVSPNIRPRVHHSDQSANSKANHIPNLPPDQLPDSSADKLSHDGNADRESDVPNLRSSAHHTGAFRQHGCQRR